MQVLWKEKWKGQSSGNWILNAGTEGKDDEVDDSKVALAGRDGPLLIHNNNNNKTEYK